MKVSQVFVVVVSVLAVLSEGCSCPGPLTTKEEYCQASFVTLAKFKSYSAATGEAEFKVSHVLKGIPEDQTTINVVVGDGSISCDLDGEGFLKNRRYLIAGSTKEGRYFVNTGCGYFVRRWKEIPLPQRREWFQIYKLVEEEVCKVERQCPENCTSYFDGCNQCGCDLETGKLTYCTERFCSPEELEEPSCTSEIDPNCNPNPCAEGETYRPGKNLSEYVYDAPASPCDTVLCNIGETCETILGAAVCRPFTTCAQVLCEAGVSVCTDGPDRDAECIPNPCALVRCGFETTCEVDGNNNAICVPIYDACSSAPCKFGGECSVDKAGGFVCDCAEGYAGTTCEEKPAPNTCGKNCAAWNNGCQPCECNDGVIGKCDTDIVCIRQGEPFCSCITSGAPHLCDTACKDHNYLKDKAGCNVCECALTAY